MEKDIEKKLTSEVRKMGGRSYKWVSPGNAGVPDRIVLLPGGRIWFIELKTETGKTTRLQEAQIRLLSRMGFDVRVLHGMAEVEDFIKEVRG